MEYNKIMTALYHLIIGVDGQINEKELQLGKQMAKVEGMGDGTFEAMLTELKPKDRSSLLTECILSLKKLNRRQQIRCIAWLCVVANSDGFMDKDEWTLIYKIYHTELGIPMNEIMETQKELNRLIHGKSFQSIGVRVND